MSDASIARLREHCTITKEHWIRRDVKQMSFDTGPEDICGKCESDAFRQTVPDTSSGDRKSSVADSRQLGAADKQ